MITIRWASFVLALVTLYALAVTEIGPATLGLALILANLIVIHCWTWGAFRCWVEQIPEGHPDEMHHTARRTLPPIADPPPGLTHTEALRFTAEEIRGAASTEEPAARRFALRAMAEIYDRAASNLDAESNPETKATHS